MDLDQVHQIPPPKPPDIIINQSLDKSKLPIVSFKDKLVQGEQEASVNMIIDTNTHYPSESQDY